MRAFRDAASAFRRAPLLSVLSVTTIAFSLFAFGLFGLVAVNIRDALQKIEERVEIRAFVADSTDPAQLATAANAIARYPEVAKVDIVTKEQALQRARRELGEFSDVFDADFLPASVDIHLQPGYRDPATVRRVATRVRGYPFVDDVRFGEEWITKLYRLRNIAAVAASGLGFAFAAVAIIIIGATIRMAVMARSKEIAIMRLVGATDGFVRRPFLVEGFAKGVMGGVLALGLTWLAMQAVEYYLNFQTVFFDRNVALAGVLFGAVIGLFGSAVSVGRHLRRV